MNAPVSQTIALRLRTLRDIDGVLGSFVISSRGELLGRDVTAACGSDVLALVGGRLQQLCNAFVSADIGGPFESTTLYFPQYKLHIRAFANLYIVAVVSAEVNLPALRMAMNMLGRQVMTDLADPALRQRDSHLPPAATARASQVPPDPAPRGSRVPPAPAQLRDSRVPPAESDISELGPRASDATESGEANRPSQEPPRPAARESGVAPRSYRGTRVAN